MFILLDVCEKLLDQFTVYSNLINPFIPSPEPCPVRQREVRLLLHQRFCSRKRRTGTTAAAEMMIQTKKTRGMEMKHSCKINEGKTVGLRILLLATENFTIL